MLEAGRRQIDAVGEGVAERWERRGAERDLFRMRDEAIAKLDDWMKDFTKIARLAFESRPQLLEKLGIKARRVRASANTPGFAALNQAASAVEASTVVHTGDQPEAYQGNGHVAISS